MVAAFVPTVALTSLCTQQDLCQSKQARSVTCCHFGSASTRALTIGAFDNTARDVVRSGGSEAATVFARTIEPDPRRAGTDVNPDRASEAVHSGLLTDRRARLVEDGCRRRRDPPLSRTTERVSQTPEDGGSSLGLTSRTAGVEAQDPLRQGADESLCSP